MAKFVIITESTSDLPKEYTVKNDINVINLTYFLGSETFDDPAKASINSKEFYDRMRAGEVASTSMINPQQAKDMIEPFLQQGKDVLYISFSSALSGSCQSAITAAAELADKYQDNKVYVSDSLCASLGQGLLVHYAVQERNAGKTAKECFDYVEFLKDKICHYFTVNSLFHLHRGGRVSKGKAIVGTLLKIKPVLFTNEFGKLMPLKNVMGRKKALQALVSFMEGKAEGIKNDTVFISHADCIEDAEYVKSLVEEKFGVKEFLIGDIGPVIGAHAGPSTVALFFMGKDKTENVN